MKRKFTLLLAAFALLTMITPPLWVMGQSDYSEVYTSNVTLTKGIHASDCKIKIDGTDYDGIKLGTAKKSGSMSVTVPAGTAYLHIHASAWKSETNSSLNIPGDMVTPNTIALTANDGITGNTPFTFNGNASTNKYYFVLELSNITSETTLTFNSPKRCVIWGVNAEGSSGSTPAIIASDVNIAYNATTGSIDYTINNAVNGGTLTASTESDWLILGEVSNASVHFTCSQNEAVAARTATVTLTYTYTERGTVTKNVAVTQAGNPNVVNNISDINTTGTYAVQGTIVAMNSRGFVVGDGTGYAYYYYGDNFSTPYTEDSIVKISGQVTTYNNVYQFQNTSTLEGASSSNYNNTPAIQVLDAAAIGNYSTGNHLSDYVQFEGKLVKSGNYYNLQVEGLSTDASISFPTSEQTTTMTGLIDKQVIVKGYFAGVSSSHFNVILGSIEEKTTTDPAITATPSPFTAPNYQLGTAEPEYNVLTVNGNNLENDISLVLNDNSDFEMSSDLEAWQSSLTLTINDGSVTNEEVAIRLKAGLTAGNHTGSVTLSSGNVEEVVTLSGSVTAPTYTIEQYSTPSSTHGTITFSPASPIEAGTEVTLTATPEDGYEFTANSWKFYNTETVQQVSLDVIEGNKITMPAFNLAVDGNFTAKSKYAITLNYNEEHGLVGTTPENEAYEGQTVTITVVAENGYKLDNLNAKYVDEESVEHELAISNTNTFAMPAYPVTVTATFIEITNVAYTLVTSTDDIVPGYHYLIASGKSDTINTIKIMDVQNNNNRGVKEVTVSGNTITLTTSYDYYDFVISGDTTNHWTIYDEKKSGFLFAASSNSNLLKTRDTNSDGNSQWTISIAEDGKATIVAQGGYTNKHMRYNTKNSLFSCYNENSSVKDLPYLYKKTTDNPIYYSPTGVTVNNPNTSTKPIVVKNNEILTLTGEVTATDPANLVIEDGGQLIFNSDNVQATVKKSTAHAGAKDDVAADWYTIASPLAANVMATDVTNLVGTFGYDFYRYNEKDVLWENYKNTAHSSDFTGFENGRGYLYWNANGEELAFIGVLGNADVSYSLKAESSGNLKGFNLIGNPFSQNITMRNITGAELPGGYVLTQAGNWKSSVESEIAPCQGFLVQVSENEEITIGKNAAKSRSNRDYIAFTASNNQYEDVTYALFEESAGLNKISHRNNNIPMIYISQNGQDYAIASMSDDTEMFCLNFKAMTMGYYTLSYEAKGKYNYLHVLDRRTGKDIDMLLDGEYRFIASPSDSEARFIVKLKYNADDTSVESDIIAHQDGNDIVVNGEGELQIFDVMGRMIATQQINGVQTINVSSTGIYIFKLNEKTQKIVVR